jgi:hypothetical protein
MPSIPLTSIGTAPTFPNDVKKWTFIQYHDADNDLGVYAYDDLVEMMKVGSSNLVNVVVLYDTFNEGATSYYLTSDGANKIRDWGEVDMGDPEVLGTFLTETMANYPAENYILNVWDHGDDFLGSCRDYHVGPGPELGERGFLYQSELLQALDGRKVSVLAFDACIQSMIEVAYDFRYSASYLIASEDYVPYHGFPYDAWLGKLVANPDMGSAEFSRIAVDEYMEEYLKPNGCGGGGYVEAFPTISAIRLNDIDGLVNSLNEFTGALSSDLRANKGIISSARAKSTLNMPIYGWDADVDLYTFVDEVSSKSMINEVISASQGIKSYWTGSDPFIYTSCSHQYSVKSAHGLGVYFPASLGSLEHNTMTDAEYYFSGSVPFAGTGWGAFLRAYFGF